MLESLEHRMEIRRSWWRLITALKFIFFFLILVATTLRLENFVRLMLVSSAAIFPSPPLSFFFHCKFFVVMRSRFETFLLSVDEFCMFKNE
jgi:hypothetical protein